MKMELWYDPVAPEISVRINGHWQDQGEDAIYGFLYPVKHYPMQAWLMPAGSWTGLRQQLEEFARGEQVDLTFYGREIDFEDLRSTLAGVEVLSLHHVEWDAQKAYRKRLGEIERLLAAMKIDWEQDEEDSGCLMISSDAQLRQAERSKTVCCLIDGDYLQSFDQLAQLERLTRLMHRPTDAICCCVAEQRRREQFQRYAKQYARMQFRFGTQEEFLGDEALRRKYIEPNQIGERLHRYAAYAHQPESFYEELKAAQQDPELGKKMAMLLALSRPRTDAEEQELAALRRQQEWGQQFDQHLVELSELLRQRVINRGEGGEPA